LKLIIATIFLPPNIVAPRAGAWIETCVYAYILILVLVAPRAGAWIETGLVGIIYTTEEVAPRAGAWIETSKWWE